MLSRSTTTALAPRERDQRCARVADRAGASARGIAPLRPSQHAPGRESGAAVLIGAIGGGLTGCAKESLAVRPNSRTRPFPPASCRRLRAMATRGWLRGVRLGVRLALPAIVGLVVVVLVGLAGIEATAPRLIAASTSPPSSGGDAGVVATAVLRARHSVQDARLRRDPRPHHHDLVPWSSRRRGRSRRS